MVPDFPTVAVTITKLTKKSCSDTTFLEALLKISIERKVDLNATDHEGRTPFHLMCITRCSTETKVFVELVRKASINVNSVEK